MQERKEFVKGLGQASLSDFIPWATRLRDAQREVVKLQHGFGKDGMRPRDLGVMCGQEEVHAFREDFQAYAHGNAIRPLDLRRLLTEKFPMLGDKSAMKEPFEIQYI